MRIDFEDVFTYMDMEWYTGCVLRHEYGPDMIEFIMCVLLRDKTISYREVGELIYAYGQHVARCSESSCSHVYIGVRVVNVHANGDAVYANGDGYPNNVIEVFSTLNRKDLVDTVSLDTREESVTTALRSFKVSDRTLASLQKHNTYVKKSLLERRDACYELEVVSSITDVRSIIRFDNINAVASYLVDHGYGGAEVSDDDIVVTKIERITE